jgi:hypothetical protein
MWWRFVDTFPRQVHGMDTSRSTCGIVEAGARPMNRPLSAGIALAP